LTSLIHFTHSLENLLERLRSSEMQATDEVIDILLREPLIKLPTRIDCV